MKKKKSSRQIGKRKGGRRGKGSQDRERMGSSGKREMNWRWGVYRERRNIGRREREKER